MLVTGLSAARESHSITCPAQQHLNMSSATDSQILNVTQFLFIGSNLNNATLVGIIALGLLGLQAQLLHLEDGETEALESKEVT